MLITERCYQHSTYYIQLKVHFDATMKCVLAYGYLVDCGNGYLYMYQPYQISSYPLSTDISYIISIYTIALRSTLPMYAHVFIVVASFIYFLLPTKMYQTSATTQYFGSMYEVHDNVIVPTKILTAKTYFDTRTDRNEEIVHSVYVDIYIYWSLRQLSVVFWCRPFHFICIRGSVNDDSIL